MKKYLALVLALVMCLSLAACGGSTSTSGNDTTENTASDTTETPANADLKVA